MYNVTLSQTLQNINKKGSERKIYLNCKVKIKELRVMSVNHMIDEMIKGIKQTRLNIKCKNGMNMVAKSLNQLYISFDACNLFRILNYN